MPCRNNPKNQNKFEKNSFLDHDKLESISDAVDISSNQKGVANATPLARRLAKEKSIDLSLVQGTGPKGRVQSEDVLKYKTDFIADSKINSANNFFPSDDSVKKLFSPGSFIEVPHDTMRKTIARRLLESKQTVPHFYVSADCELDRLLAAREEMNAAAPLVDGKPAYKISVNDFVIKALAVALQRVPDANVTWTAAKAAAEAKTTVPLTKTSSKCGLTPSSCQTFNAYDGLPGPANSHCDSRIEFTASPKAAPVTDVLRSEIAFGVTPTECEKNSISFSVRSSAFSWNPNGVSKIVRLSRSSLPNAARIC